LKQFPLTLKVVEGLGYKEIEVKTKEELIDLIQKEIDKPEQLKLIDICDNLGIYDTISLFDRRTFQLWELYQTYKYAPHLIDNMIFQDAVLIFNQYEPRVF